MAIHLPALSALFRPFQSGGARCGPGLDVDELGDRARAHLGPILYEIFCESYGALDRETVCDEIVFRSGGRLFLFRDASDTIVGFGTFAVQEVVYAGRPQSVIQSGAYMRRGVRGVGAAVGRRAVALAVVEKLRRPWRPLCWAVEALTPITYRLLARTFPRIYPNRHEDTPARAAGLVSTIIAARGLLTPADNPFVVSYPDPASHAAPERITLSEKHLSDPEIRFYLEQNPRFVDGHILCVLIPFDGRELVAAARQTVAGLVGGR